MKQLLRVLLVLVAGLGLSLTLSLALGAGARAAPAPVQTDLRLGAGDQLRIAVYGHADLGTDARVSETGNISFPLLGQVALGGLSTAVAEKKIAGLLEQGGFVRQPQVNIIVSAVHSRLVSVLGQVNRPGRYPLEGQRSVLDMLAMAGGIAPDGGDKVSLIRTRDGKTTRDEIDVIQMVREGALAHDHVLAGSDLLFVERAPRFYIVGEVQRPGAFRLERAMTVMQALSAGGGLSPRGSERGLLIRRRDPQGRVQVIDVRQDDLVQIDDVLVVKESWF